jgi:hypothetical protein
MMSPVSTTSKSPTRRSYVLTLASRPPRTTRTYTGSNSSAQPVCVAPGCRDLSHTRSISAPFYQGNLDKQCSPLFTWMSSFRAFRVLNLASFW